MFPQKFPRFLSIGCRNRTAEAMVANDSSLARSGVAEQAATVDTLESVERNHIIRALNDTNWVIHGKRGAAEILGINPSTLRSRMAKLGIVRSRS